MPNWDVRSLLDQIHREEKGASLGLYTLVLFAVLSIALVLLVAALILSPPFSIPFHWLAALLAGIALSGLILMLVTFVRLKSRWAGLILNILLILSWLGWIFLVLRPVAADPSATQWAFAVPVFAAVVIFLLSLYYVANFVLPIFGDREQRLEVFKLLLDYFQGQNYPCYVVTDEPWEEDKIVERISGNVFGRANFGPGVVLSPCNHAVAISDGTKFKGVKGPGVIFTGFGDNPVRTLDLRPQLRTSKPQALTKDGIQVKVLFFAPFQVDRGNQQPQLKEPFPYRKSAAFKVVHHQQIEHESGNETNLRAWDELPLAIGERLVQDILSRYEFDDLYGPHTMDEAPPRVHIAGEFVERLRQELLPMGLYVVGGGVSNIEPVNEEVLKRRVRSWQANWARQVMLKQAKSQTERIQRIERARAEAQADLILKLGEMLAELDRPGAGVRPEEILPEFLGVLEDLAMRPGLRRYLPQDVKEDVQRLRAPFEEEGGG